MYFTQRNKKAKFIVAEESNTIVHLHLQASVKYAILSFYNNVNRSYGSNELNSELSTGV